MAKNLVIVESPAKARTISRYLGSGYEVAASVGHVMDLPRKELGVDVEHGFAPTFEVIHGKGKVIKELKSLARNANRIILATDPDREGEAIASHVAQQLGIERDPDRFERVKFREVTKAAVQQAIDNPEQLDVQKVEAQQARRILDRLVGYGVSPFLWKPIRPGLSAGRVQTVALRLICEREDEIRKFVEQEYWSITAHLARDGQNFDAKLHKIDSRSVSLGNESEAMAAVSAVADLPFVVTDVKRRERRKNPAPPFRTSTLQQEAAKRLGFSARRTMSTAQRLYEGVEVPGHGTTGLITYMRTDSVRVSPSAVEAARGWIASEFGEPFRPPQPRNWGTQQKGAQEAHEAIRPTNVLLHPNEVTPHLERDQARLYELIWMRFVASQMSSAVYDTTTVDFDLDGTDGHRYTYRASGSVVKFQGFTRLYLEAVEEGDHRRLDDLDPLPELDQGLEAELGSLEPKQHFTQPPPRYSEASLVKELEAQGIGRPSTYAAIMSRIVDQDYVVLESKRFHPTDLGEVVFRLLDRTFPDIFQVDFTSNLEDRLDKIEEGEVGWVELLAGFYPTLKKRLDQGDKVSEDVLKEILEAKGEVCEKCGRPMLVKFNKRGKFLGCSGYPECSTTRSLDADERVDRVVGADPATGRDVRVKVGPYGPYVELEAADDEKKPQRVSLPDGVDPEQVSLETALRYLQLPRALGTTAEGDEALAGLGRYGPFVKVGKTYASLPDHDSMFTVDLAEAVRLVEEKKKTGGKKVIRELGAHPSSGADIQLLEGRYGPYVTDGKTNASLPKTEDPDTVDLDRAVELLAAKAARGGRGGRSNKAGARSTAAKKTGAKKTTAKKAATKKPAAKSRARKSS